MYGREKRVLLREYLEQGLTKTALAVKLGLSRRTIHHWIGTGQLDRERFETPPGHQAQVDFAHFRFPWGRRWALLLVLGFSRLLWLRFFERQDMRTLFEGLEEALRFLGGVPQGDSV